MSRFINDATKVVVSVDDSKDDRFGPGWTKADDDSKKSPARKTAKSES